MKTENVVLVVCFALAILCWAFVGYILWKAGEE